MTIEQFDLKYKKKGGIAQLNRMMSDLATLEEIRKHFNISRERVRQWTKEMMNGYDPRCERKSRRLKVIKSMLKAVKGDKNKLKEQGVNKYYLKLLK